MILYGGTFLVFADYMRGSMRSALSELGVIYVLTHDSIGVGEDGPTHQPIETIPSLRAMPNMLVFRPGDGNETSGATSWRLRTASAPALCASAVKAWSTKPTHRSRKWPSAATSLKIAKAPRADPDRYRHGA